MPRKIVLQTGEAATISTDKIVISSKGKKENRVIPLFPERTSLEWKNSVISAETAPMAPLADPFKKPYRSTIHGGIGGAIKEDTLKYDPEKNTITGEFSGMRTLSEKGGKKFLQHNSTFVVSLTSGDVTEKLDAAIKADAKIEAKADIKAKTGTKTPSSITEMQEVKRPRKH